MKTTESTGEIKIPANKRLKLTLNEGDITLHLKRIDGIELTYQLNKKGDCFIEEVREFNTYQIIVNKESDYVLEIS